MSTTLRQLVKTIFSDPDQREQFMANPEGFLSKYSLTDTERKAILYTNFKLGPTAGQSARVEAAIDPLIDWM
jgi:hypothetical protein